MENNQKPVRKNVFKYNNGIEDIYGDPFEIDWRLQEATKLIPNMDMYDKRLDLPLDDDGNFQDSVTPVDIALYNDALHFYVPIVTKAFELLPFDKKTGEGMTGEEIINLYSSYIQFKIGLKKNTDDQPTSAINSDSRNDSLITSEAIATKPSTV